MIYIHHYNIIQNICSVLTIPCALLIHYLPQDSLTPLLWPIDLFIVSIVLCFLECHRVEMTLYEAFSSWLLSLSYVYLNSSVCFLWIDNIFALNNILLSGCATIYLFIHLLKEGVILSSKLIAPLGLELLSLSYSILTYVYGLISALYSVLLACLLLYQSKSG